MSKNYLLIDGHSLAYRAFFALPQTLSTTQGQITNAVYGFMTMLLKVLEEEKPNACIVALDGPRSELFRTKEFPTYKAQRKPMPDELKAQISLIVDILKAMEIPVVQVDGYEADDIIGTLAKRIGASGNQATILTGDRDVLQLVDQNVRVLMTEKGITEVKAYSREDVIDKYSVPPENIPDLVGLKGDTSDNIPGVPGIGEKGASELICGFGSLEALYEGIDRVSGRKRKDALLKNRELAFLSKKLATIETGVPLDIDLDSLELGRWHSEKVLEQLSSLEFNSLVERFLRLSGNAARKNEYREKEEISCELLEPAGRLELKAFLDLVSNTDEVSICGNLTPGRYCETGIESIAVCSGEKVAVFKLTGLTPRDLEPLKEFFSSSLPKVIMHEGKGLVIALEKLNITVKNVLFDTAIAAYLENPSLGSYPLGRIWDMFGGKTLDISGSEAAENGETQLLDAETPKDSSGLARDALRIFHLYPLLEEKLERNGMMKLYREIEMPLMLVLKKMEQTGVAVDSEILNRMSKEAKKEIEALEESIFKLVGHRFNVGSPKQVAQVLFEELGLPPAKKTKSGYSTDSSVLESLRGLHPVVGKILEHREYSKLKSTYFDVLPALVCPVTGRIHCTYNQTATATGRISSSNPNLQNIPVRGELGRKIRSAFVPGESGWKLLVADYSQIELRVLAHMSRDPLLIEAFARDADIHAETAASLFGVLVGEVTPEMRRMAKVVNFGVVYGMGNYGLSTRLGISREEATAYIDKYFERYTGVREYRENCVREALSRGYTETLFGRRRYIPELKSSQRQVKELGERLAINTPLQGTAADIIKKAMVQLSRSMEERGLASRMILQVHDELLFEVPPEEVDEMKGLVKSKMSGVIELEIPLKVDVSVVDNWGEAK